MENGLFKIINSIYYNRLQIFLLSFYAYYEWIINYGVKIILDKNDLSGKILLLNTNQASIIIPRLPYNDIHLVNLSYTFLSFFIISFISFMLQYIISKIIGTIFFERFVFKDLLKNNIPNIGKNNIYTTKEISRTISLVVSLIFSTSLINIK